MNNLVLGAALFGMGEAIRLRSGVASAVAAAGLMDSAEDKCAGISDNVGTDLGSFPTWLAYVIAICGMLIGLFENFYGYKYWAVTVFIITGYIAAVVTYAIIMGAMANSSSEYTLYYAYGGAAAAGIIVGVIFSIFRKFAVFVIGAGCGVILALILQPLVLTWIWSEQPNTLLYIMMAVLGLLFGLLTLVLERPIVIIATSSVGSYVFIYSLSQLAGHLPSPASAYWKQVASAGASCVSWQVWAYMGGLIALGLIGVLVQFCHTGRDSDHRANRRKDNKNLQQDQRQPLYGGGGTRYV